MDYQSYFHVNVITANVFTYCASHVRFLVSSYLCRVHLTNVAIRRIFNIAQVFFLHHATHKFVIIVLSLVIRERPFENEHKAKYMIAFPDGDLLCWMPVFHQSATESW